MINRQRPLRLTLAALALPACMANSARATAQTEETPQQTWTRIEKAIAPDCSHLNRTQPMAEAAEEVAWRTVLRRKLTKIELHRSLACLEAPLTAPVEVPLDCNGVDGDGLTDCRSTAELRPDVVRAAVWQVLSRGAVTKHGEHFGKRFRIHMTVRVDPADAITYPPRDYAQPPISFGAVNWIEAPTAEDLTKLYPPFPQRLELQGGFGALCRIEANGRLLCVEAMVSGQADFFDVIEPVAARYRAAPTLNAGQPSAGRWVILKVSFKLPE